MTDRTGASLTLKSPPSELVGTVVARCDLTPSHLEQMYGLLGAYFEGVSRERFAADLAEKEWVVLLTRPATGEVRGFSTLMRIALSQEASGTGPGASGAGPEASDAGPEASGAGPRASGAGPGASGAGPVVAYFSGDTIIHRDDWGSPELPRTWIHHAMDLARREQGARVYWYLISSGYKTYRFLPVFFREFYPTWERPTPPEVQRLLDELGRQKFGAQYDPGRGVIRFREAAPLRQGVAEVTERRLKDPAVAFFVQANPGHGEGDELACIAELNPANFTPAGLRMLGGRL